MTRFELFPAQPPDDAYLLARWRDVPLTFTPGAVPAGWHLDRYEHHMGQGAELFAAARDRLLRYQFYPPKVIIPTADFANEGRTMRPGDRVVIRIALLRPLGWPLLDVLVHNQISTVVDEPRRVQVGYTTTAAHFAIGEWQAAVTHQPDNAVSLTVRSVSRVGFVPPITRFYQKRAHRLGMAHFIRGTKQGLHTS